MRKEIIRTMTQLAVVIHYHELWLKGRNRRFFVSQLGGLCALGLEGIPSIRSNVQTIVSSCGLKEGASLEDTL